VLAQPRTSGPKGQLTLLAFATLCSDLAPLNSTMIAVALPRIRDDFGLAPGVVGWLVSGYLIAMAVAQPVAGRLGDQLGRGRVVRVGLLAFVAASVTTTFAPNFPVLIALRRQCLAPA
jgi:MFS family permease